MYEYEILKYFPSFHKSPIYIDNTHTILWTHPFLPTINHPFIKTLLQSNLNTITKIKNVFQNINSYYYQLFALFLFTGYICIFIYNKYLISPLTNKIEELEQKIKYLNKKDNLLENDVEKYTLMNKKTQEEMEKKIKYYEKEMKKMKKEINKYN